MHVCSVWRSALTLNLVFCKSLLLLSFHFKTSHVSTAHTFSRTAAYNLWLYSSIHYLYRLSLRVAGTYLNWHGQAVRANVSVNLATCSSPHHFLLQNPAFISPWTHHHPWLLSYYGQSHFNIVWETLALFCLSVSMVLYPILPVV